MPDVAFKVKSKSEVDQAVMDALLARALWLHAEKEADALEAESRQDAAYLSHVRARRPQMLALIRREQRKAALSGFAVRTLPRVGKACALLLLAFYIALTAAIATVESVRVRVAELLIHRTEEYTELRLEENPQLSFDVPAGWKGDHFPSAIPDGYRLAQLVDQDFAGYNAVSYANADGMRLTFMECAAPSETNLDTEGADITFLTVGGRCGFLSQKNGSSFVVWSELERYFVLETDEDSATALAIAESVVRIR